MRGIYMIRKTVSILRVVTLLGAVLVLAASFVLPLLAGPQPDSTGVATRELPTSWTTIIGYILFGLSELCSLLPGVKANGVIQLILIVLQKLSPPK
jgi:hypothetical protein